jgi:hypothetical protein
MGSVPNVAAEMMMSVMPLALFIGWEGGSD